MRENTKKIAICGVMGALAIVVMLLGSILPLATFSAPAIAGILIMPVAIEYGNKSGFLLYVTISLLSIFIAADKEMAFAFIFILGHYPLLKTMLERIKIRILKIFAKFAVFNIAVISMYGVFMLLFPVDQILKQLEMESLFTVGLLIFANVTFVIYDFAIARIVGIYCAVWRKKLMKIV